MEDHFNLDFGMILGFVSPNLLQIRYNASKDKIRS